MGVFSKYDASPASAAEAGSGSTPPAPGEAQVAKPTKKKQKKEERLSEADAFFDSGAIPELRITIAKDDLERLRGDGRADVGVDIRETLAAQANEYVDVAAHTKGSAGSNRGIDDKPGLTLTFDKFKQGQAFHKLTKVNLNNGVQDQTFMVENLGNALFRDAGIPGCRCTNARVWLNDRDLGLYVLKEGFDDAFLERHFAEPGGTLYEPGFVRDVDGGLSERANTNKRDRTTVKELMAAAADGDQARRRQRLEKVVDVDRFFTFMAMEALTAHWDGYTGNRNNYRLYHDPGSGKLVFLPHGMDQLFQRADYLLQPANALVAQALTAAPDDRARYFERLEDLRRRVFTPENLNKHIDRISAALAAGAKSMGGDALRQHEEATKQLRSRVLDRVREVDRQLAAIPKPLKFAADGTFALPAEKWVDKPESGDVKIERAAEGGKSVLHLKSPGGGGGAVSVRQAINLPQGKYAFEGRVKLAGVTVADGTQNAGVGLRVSGGQRTAAQKGTADWSAIAPYEIDVTEASRDVTLVVEFRVTTGEAWVELDSLKLRKR